MNKKVILISIDAMRSDGLKQCGNDCVPEQKEAFMEEQQLKKELLSSIKINHFQKYSIITMPYYFPFSKEPLSLTLFKKGDSIFVTDWGRAYSELKKRLPKTKARKMAKYFLRVYFESELKLNNYLIAPVRSPERFFDYLQMIAQIINADLYPQIDNYYFKNYKKYSKRYYFLGKTHSAEELTDKILTRINVRYDKYKGITVHTPFYFKDEACPMCLALNKEGESIIVTNYGDFDGGRLFERIEWLNDDIRLLEKDILDVCKRYSCDYLNQEFSLAVNKEQINKGIFDFMQMASVLGQMGHFIVL